MSKRYIEIDSTYRNRTQYPNPAEFVMEISQTGVSSVAGIARDPISFASPSIFWNSSLKEFAQSANVAITAVNLLISDPDLIYITGTYNTFRKSAGYYVGLILNMTDSLNVNFITRITSYKLISSSSSGGDVALCGIDIPLAVNFPSGTVSGVITTNTNVTNVSTTLVPALFVANGATTDNFYINQYVQFYDSTIANPLTTTESVLITSYSGTTNQAVLANTTNNNFYNNGNFIIREQLPTTSGAVVYPTSLPATTNIIQLSPTGSNPISGSYNSSFLRLLTPFPNATNGYSTITAPYSYQYKINNYIAGSGKTASAITSGTNTFTLSLVYGNPTVNITGALITIDINGTIETQLVATYNSQTGTGTIASTWSSNHSSGVTWNTNSVILGQNITLQSLQSPQTANYYEIEQFSKDSWSPFMYSGSLVSSQESVCYEVECISLIVPNLTITSGYGGNMTQYPYVYVALEPVSSSSNYRNILYSNNPNSFKVLFSNPCNDTTQKQYSSFLKINSGGMAQTIKFKPNDSFYFSVKLPSGDVFQTSPDTVSPSGPNPFVQIYCVFSFKRVG